MDKSSGKSGRGVRARCVGPGNESATTLLVLAEDVGDSGKSINIVQVQFAGQQNTS
jgi:hypothetical protein